MLKLETRAAATLKVTLLIHWRHVCKVFLQFPNHMITVMDAVHCDYIHIFNIIQCRYSLFICLK